MDEAVKLFKTRGSIIASLGSAVEWYDFSIYGYFAHSFALLYFPEDSEGLAIILTYATFALGFVARPLGAIFFGHIGDRYCRSSAIKISLIMMLVPSLFMALLPTYQQWGIAAPLLLLFLRILQGLSLGGQYTGTLIYLFESAPKSKRSYFVSFTWVFATIGFLLGAFIPFVILLILPKSMHLNYAWRIGYALSLVFVVILWCYKDTLKDAVPHDIKRKTPLPIRNLITKHSKSMFIVMGLVFFQATSNYIIVIFLVGFMHKYGHISMDEALLINTIATAMTIFLMPFYGRMADEYGRKPLMIMGCVFTAIIAPMTFYLISNVGGFWLNLIAVCALLSSFCLYVAPAYACYVEQFPPDVRFSGCSLCYNLIYAIFGGTAPLVAVILIQYFGSLTAPAYYIMLSSLVSFIVVLRMAKSTQ